MGAIEETEKRLVIAKEISSQLEGVVRGIILGGSMGYGQNFSVTEASDIDMVVIADKTKARNLENTDYFRGEVPIDVLELFEKGVINLFWVTKHVRGIEVNSFVYETRGYTGFCLLNGNLIGYIPTKPQETQNCYRFNGEPVTFNRSVRPYGKGFLYEKPALADGKFWGGPPRSDFLVGGHVLYESKNFLKSLSDKVWKSTIKQMIKEYGSNIDLSKINILNTDFTFQRKPEKLPQKIIDAVQERTLKELLI